MRERTRIHCALLLGTLLMACASPGPSAPAVSPAPSPAATVRPPTPDPPEPTSAPAAQESAPTGSGVTPTWVLEMGNIDAQLPKHALAATALLWIRGPREGLLAGDELARAVQPSILHTLRSCADTNCVKPLAAAASARILVLRREGQRLIVERVEPTKDGSLHLGTAALPTTDDEPGGIWIALRAALEGVYAPSELHTMGSLPRTLAVSTIERHKVEVRTCYGLAMRETDSTSATVRLALRIEPDGSVARALVTSASLEAPLAARCTGLASRRWRFAAPSGGAEVLHLEVQLRRHKRRAGDRGK